MPALTIGRMAKLYGLHRSTLYEAVERGRVTAGLNEQGQRVIELSEMIRVYGEATGQPDTPARHPTPAPDTSPTPADSELLARFDALLEVVKEQRDELKALREEVHQMRRLPAPRVDEGNTVDTPRERPEKPQEAPKPKPRQGGALDFSDLEARLAARIQRQS